MTELLNLSGWGVETKHIVANFVTSLLFLGIVMTLRYSTIKLVASWKLKNVEDKRRWIVHIRNFSFSILLLGLVIIWAAEIRTLAISIVAVAAALVIGTKEILSCFLGGLLKVSNKLFEVGDRIEIQGNRGDVLDHTFLVTTLYEVGHKGRLEKYTGRVLKIPNSVFLTHPVINDTNSAQYCLHTIRIPIPANLDWANAEKILLRAAHDETKDYISHARRYLTLLENRDGIEVPGVEPKVFLDMTERGGVMLHLRIPTKSSLKGQVEQNIMRRFATEFYPAKMAEA